MAKWASRRPLLILVTSAGYRMACSDKGQISDSSGSAPRTTLTVIRGASMSARCLTLAVLLLATSLTFGQDEFATEPPAVKLGTPIPVEPALPIPPSAESPPPVVSCLLYTSPSPRDS